MSELAEAIRAWEAARAVAGEARKAWLAAQANQDAALNAVLAREEEARSAALRLMPPWVTVGEKMPFDGAEGCVVDGRFYYRVADAIHWMKVADPPAESPPPSQPTEEPDGDWKRCDMTCPGCKEAGHVFSRIWESPWDGYKDMRYECRNCGDAWPVGRAAP